MGDSPTLEEQGGELNPNDAWLMRAAGGEDGTGESAPAGAPQRDDDQFSFEDSERFEEDSLCSWVSDAESLNQNWRGWNAPRSSNSQLPVGTTLLEPVYPDAVPIASTSHRYLGSSYSGSSHRGRHSSNSSLKVASPTGASPYQILNRTTRLSGVTSTAPKSLAELASRKASRYFSFEALEASYQNIIKSRSSNSQSAHVAIPDTFFLGIVRWCFPDSEEDIRLYSCLANGNVEEFGRGEYLYHTDCVQDVFQIGYHLAATVVGSISGSTSGESLNATVSSGPQNQAYGHQLSKAPQKVCVTIDRCRIVSCACSCNYKASWCQHVVAACLHRINRHHDVKYRVTIWDAINELGERELRKFVQFFINELPRQYLPLAQLFIDQLRDPHSQIHAAVGAPDPTDGGHEDAAIWCLDQKMLHENIRRILAKFCLPSPTVHCDVHYLSSSQPAAAAEWQLLLRPHRSKEPEGLWNLMSIVREMFKRRDENATTLLHIVTEECLGNPQVLMWWYQTALTHSGKWFLCSSGNKPNPLMSNPNVPQFSLSSLCDEIIYLWRLAALNPSMLTSEKDQLAGFLHIYHRNACEKIWKVICTSDIKSQIPPQTIPLIFSVIDKQGERLSPENARFTLDLFPGFFGALKACCISWDGFESDGIDISSGPSLNFEQLFAVPAVPSSFLSEWHESSAHSGPSRVASHRHTRSSDSSALVDLSGASRTSHRHHHRHASSSVYTANSQETSRSAKRKKKSKLSRKRGRKQETHTERPQARPALVVAQSVHEPVVSEEVEEDSAESGQESEGPGPSSKASKAGDLNSEQRSKDLKPRSRKPDFPSGDIDELFAYAHESMPSFDVRFTRCEALMSHGYQRLASKLAVGLASEIIKRPPNLLFEATNDSKRGRDISSVPAACGGAENAAMESGYQTFENNQNPATLLSRAVFLVQLLMKERSTCRLAFSLAIFVLEMPRSPASTKFLEVKLYHLEMELVALLRRVEITQAELNSVRECARRFIANAPARATKVCVLPISLAHYILDALSYAHNVTAVAQGRRYGTVIPIRGNVQRYPSDEDLSVRVALEGLNMKLLVSEAEHPMLCESTRRQRGELALTMLMRYKESVEKLALVLDGLLDPRMHRMYKDHLSNAAYFVEQDVVQSRQYPGHRPKYPSHGQDMQWLRENVPKEIDAPDGFASAQLTREYPINCIDSARQATISGVDADVSQLAEAINGLGRETGRFFKFQPQKREVVDESTEGTSEDSSYTRDLGAMLESQSASAETSGSASPAPRTVTRNEISTDAPAASVIRLSEWSGYYRHSRRKPIPSSPNQPSEAHAHYMMELAKRLLIEAGGSQSTAVFNAAQNIGVQNNPQHGGPHRQLHICSFLIGLYALGLNNLVSASWQTRTYSTNVSWINGQAIEIGYPAIRIIERVWEAHLTPTEAADLADKASQSRDQGMVEAAAKLALSVLPKAYALTATESQKALHQCKEQSTEMLEKACHAVEMAAEKDGVYPEVLFKVAHLWYDMFCESESTAAQQNISPGSSGSPTSSPQPTVPPSAAATPNTLQIPQQQSYPAYVATAPAVPLPMPMYVPRQHMQQSLCPSPQFYNMPAHHAHSSGRPVVLAAGTSVQPQILVPYGLRPANLPQPGIRPVTQQQGGRHLNQASSSRTSAQQSLVTGTTQPVIYNGVPQLPLPQGYPQPQGAESHSSRALHVSHSAPNLNPMQMPSYRHGMPMQLSANGQQHYGRVGTIPEEQNSMNLRGQHQGAPGMIVQPAAMPNQLGNPNFVLPPFYAQSPQLSPAIMFNGDPRMAKLVHAHRVGMKAMETMGTRNHDDTRSYAKFSQNPAYADDVRWLFQIAAKLGGVFVQSFCEVAAHAVASPFVLFKLSLESREVFKNMQSQLGYHPTSLLHPYMRSQYANNPTPLKYNPAPKDVRVIMMQNGYDPSTAELMQHCVEMLYAAASSKLSHPRFVPADTEDVLQLVKTARDGFYSIPVHGKGMFEDFLRHVKKQKACKRDVAERIKGCLQLPG